MKRTKSIECDSFYGGNQEILRSRIPATPREKTNQARRYVAGRARDADDCRLLLDALGLLEPVAGEEVAS